MKKLAIDRVVQERRLCDVFDDAHGESFIAFITGHSESLLQLECYDEEGRIEGLLVLPIDDVSRIRWGAQETEYVAKLIASRSNFPPLNLASIPSTAREVQDRFGYVCFTLGNVDSGITMIGQIVEEEAETLLLHEYRTPSKMSRSFCMMRWSDITRIHAGGSYEENLHRHYQKEPETPDLHES